MKVCMLPLHYKLMEDWPFESIKDSSKIREWIVCSGAEIHLPWVTSHISLDKSHMTTPKLAGAGKRSPLMWVEGKENLKYWWRDKMSTIVCLSAHQMFGSFFLSCRLSLLPPQRRAAPNSHLVRKFSSGSGFLYILEFDGCTAVSTTDLDVLTLDTSPLSQKEKLGLLRASSIRWWNRHSINRKVLPFGKDCMIHSNH